MLNLVPSRSGQNAGGWSHLLPYAFATHLLFGSVSVLNTLALEFFFLYPRPIRITLIDSSIDVLVWAASTVSLSALTIWSSKGRSRQVACIGLGLIAIVLSLSLLTIAKDDLFHRVNIYALFIVATAELFSLTPWREQVLGKPSRLLSRVLIYLLAYFAVIEIASATHYVIQAFDITTQIGRTDAAIELQFSYVTYGSLPLLYVAFLFSWAWVPLVQRLLPKNPLVRLGGKASPEPEQGLLSQGSSSGSRLSILVDPRFFLIVAFALFIGYYPYFHNPPWLVGTDAYWRYYDPLMHMNARGIFGGFAQALNERHPVPLILLYAAQLIFQTTAFDVVRYTPFFLIVTLSLSMWWFLARRKSLSFGLLVFMLSTMSITTTVGMYSSILANWMVLVGWVVFFAYVGFRGDEKFRVLDFVVLLAMSTVLLLIHPWTWGVFAAAILLIAILTLVQEKRKELRSAGLLIIIISLDVLFAFLSLTLLAASQGWRVAEALDLYTFVIRNPSTVLFFWGALTRLTEIWSPFFSPLYLAASILGVFCLKSSNLTRWRQRLIFAWLVVTSLGSLLVAPVGFDPANVAQSESQLWRVLFLTPFQVLAPFGVAWVVQLPHRFRSTEARKAGERNDKGETVSLPWFALLLIAGIAMVWAPVWGRFLLVLVFLPLVTALLLSRSWEAEDHFLSSIILVLFLLVALNNTMRLLSQVLIAPHNYRPD